MEDDTNYSQELTAGVERRQKYRFGYFLNQ